MNPFKRAEVEKLDMRGFKVSAERDEEQLQIPRALRVMQKDEVTRARRPERPREAFGRRRENRVVEPGLPENQRCTDFPRRAQELWRTHAGGGTKSDRRRARDFGNRRLASVNPILQPFAPEKIIHVSMVGRVISDRVAPAYDLPHELRILSRAAANQKESRMRPELGEEGEHARGPHRIRPVIKRQVKGLGALARRDSPNAQAGRSHAISLKPPSRFAKKVVPETPSPIVRASRSRVFVS